MSTLTLPAPADATADADVRRRIADVFADLHRHPDTRVHLVARAFLNAFGRQTRQAAWILRRRPDDLADLLAAYRRALLASVLDVQADPLAAVRRMEGGVR